MQIASPFSRCNLARWSLIAARFTSAALIAAALLLSRPLPPQTLVMATGPEDSAYTAIGRRYRKIVARHDVELKLRLTNGSVDNVELRRDPRSGVSAALVMSGITDPTQSPTLVSLGSVFYEPFWLFTRVTRQMRQTRCEKARAIRW